MKKLLLLITVAVFSCMMFSSCSETTKSGPEGDIKIYLTDKPADFDAVNIVVSEVSVHMSGDDSVSGWTVICDSIQQFDLLQLRNGAMELFADHGLQPGHYTQIRLKVTNGCSVMVDGSQYGLEIPSGYQSGIKINHQFWIDENEIYELLLDFDAEKSIIEKSNGEYQLKPVIRAIAIQTSGGISGMVNPKDAEALALVSPDTLAYSHTDTSGFFNLVGLPEGLYSVQIVPDDVTYADTTIMGVAVVAGQTTDLGTIELRLQ